MSDRERAARRIKVDSALTGVLPRRVGSERDVSPRDTTLPSRNQVRCHHMFLIRNHLFP